MTMIPESPSITPEEQAPQNAIPDTDELVEKVEESLTAPEDIASDCPSAAVGGLGINAQANVGEESNGHEPIPEPTQLHTSNTNIEKVIGPEEAAPPEIEQAIPEPAQPHTSNTNIEDVTGPEEAALPEIEQAVAEPDQPHTSNTNIEDVTGPEEAALPEIEQAIREPTQSHTTSTNTKDVIEPEEAVSSKIEQFQRKLDRSEEEITRLREELDRERRERRRRDMEIESLRDFVLVNDASQRSAAAGLIKNINNATSTFAGELSVNWDFAKGKLPFKGDRTGLQAIELALVQCDLECVKAPLLLQYAIQSCILGAINEVLRHVCYGMDQRFEKFILHLQNCVSTTESQSTFARWRSITYGILISDSSVTQQEKLCRRIIRELDYIGELLTGRRTKFDDETTKTVHDIISKAVQFSRITRTGIFSANYYHVYPLTGALYDETKMEMPHSSTVPESEDIVVVTLQLGLVTHERIGTKGVGETEDLWSVRLKSQVLTQREVRELAANTAVPVLPSALTKLTGAVVERLSDWAKPWTTVA